MAAGGTGGQSGASAASPPSASLVLSPLWRAELGRAAAGGEGVVVHLQSGYLDVYRATGNRAQVVVAVTAGREVHCIDGGTGALLWSRRVGDSGGGGQAGSDDEEAVDAGAGGGAADEAAGGRVLADDVAALINPHPMRVNDSGVVVVALRLWPSGHFSHFAFSGRAGLLRWSHDAADFQAAAAHPPGLPSSHVLHEAHAVHTGEVEWRNYRAAFLAALPHQWRGARDSSLQLAQVSPPQRQGGLGTKAAEEAKRLSSRRAAASLSASLPSSSLLAVAASARWAHDDAEHLPHPNAVVAHTAEGVELLSFYTGRPLAHLPLQRGQLHVDVNGDGVVDHLQLLSGAAAGGDGGGEDEAAAFASASWLHSASPCTAVVSSAIPPSSHLFNVSLCTSALTRLLTGRFGLGGGLGRWQGPGGAGGGRRGRGKGAGVGGIPFTQSMQGRRHLRLAGAASKVPGGRRRFPRRKPHPLASAADDGSPAILRAQEEGGEGDEEGAGEEAALGGVGGPDGGDGADEEEDREAAEWVAAPLALPSVRSASASSALFALYFLSSQGLLTAVDGRGRKVFSTRTSAAITGVGPVADQQSHRLLLFDLKMDHSQVAHRSSPTAAAHLPSAPLIGPLCPAVRLCRCRAVRSVCCWWARPPWCWWSARVGGCWRRTSACRLPPPPRPRRPPRPTPRRSRRRCWATWTATATWTPSSSPRTPPPSSSHSAHTWAPPCSPASCWPSSPA